MPPIRFRLILTVVALILCAGTTSHAQQVNVVTTHGTSYVGSVVRESADSVVIDLGHGIEAAIPRSSIRSFDSSYVRHEHGYIGFGLSVGLPSAALNFVLEANIGGRFGFRVSGSGLFVQGVEIDGLIRLGLSRGVDHGLLVGGGRWSADRGLGGVPEVERWTYLHLGYKLYHRGFDMTCSVSLGEGDYTNPTLLVQFGYLFRAP